MKKFLLVFLTLLTNTVFSSDIEGYEKSDFYSGGKSAIVMAHFGTTHADTREKTIDVINSKVKKAFKNKADIYEVYTSRIIINRLNKNEKIKKLTITQMLKELKKQGYKNIIVQPTTIIDGIEMKTLLKEIEKFSNSFKNLRVGIPLLSTPENYEKVIKSVTDLVGPLRESQAIVMVGHGTYDSSTSAYAMLDYVAKDMDRSVYVGTVEGYPAFENVMKQLKKDGKKEIILMPLMFVAGDHAKNDIAGDWKKQLKEAGFDVGVKLIPLGEIPAIQNIYIENIKLLERYKKVDMLKKKSEYLKAKNL